MKAARSRVDTTCPGCGLGMPKRDSLEYHGYYNASPECCSVYTEVLGAEFSNAVLFGQVHQLTVDAYAVQHAGGPHPDKSVDVHLVGLHLVLERGLPPTSVPQHLRRLAEMVKEWPHFEPLKFVDINVSDVALSSSHADTVREWSSSVWKAWSPHHVAVRHLAGVIVRA